MIKNTCNKTIIDGMMNLTSIEDGIPKSLHSTILSTMQTIPCNANIFRGGESNTRKPI